MKLNFSDKGKTTPCKLVFTALLLFFTYAGYSQTVDCSNNANCNDPYCQAAPAQEKGCNCFDNLDNDNNGKTDRQDLKCAQYYGLTFVGGAEGDCSLDAPAGNPFASMAPPAVSGQNTSDTQSKVSVGDIDGDNIPDAVITSKWNSEMRVVATKTHTVGGVNYDPGDIKADFKTTGQGAKFFSGSGGCDPKNLLFEHENLIANIDKTGPAELFGIVSNRGGNPSTPPTCFFMVGFRYTPGANGLIPMYDAVSLGPDRPGAIGIADMDGDGKAEVYMRDRIYAAETGVLLASGGGNWDLDITSGPVAVDVVKGDNGKMELVCGTKIFSIPNLSNRNPGSPAALTLVKDMNTLVPGTKAFVKLANDPVEYGTDTHSMCSVADLDNDGNIDVVISGALNSVSGKTAVFYWNVAKDKFSYFIVPDAVYPNGWPWGTGRVNLMDADNDKTLDLFFVAGGTLFRVKTVGDSFDPDINGAAYATNVTTRIINDSRSGVLTVTIYDFNNDGQFELVYRDSQELVVVDAKTMATKFWSATCQSHTYTEGPIIADVNGDGATDICVPCNRNNSFDINDPIQQQALGEVRLFFSSTNAWVPTRKVWNQPGYFVININDNLTLPFPQYDMTTIFSEGTCSSNGLSGPQRPLNVFLNQLPYISASGCPVFPAPDLAYFGDDPNQPGVDTNGDGVMNPAVVVTPPICGNTDVKVVFNLINSGLLPISKNVPVSFYNGDPRLGPGSSTFLHTTNLNINLPVGVTTVSAPVTFNGPGTTFDLYIVLDNTGFPVPAAGKSTTECKLENNVIKITVVPTPFLVTAALVKDNTICAPTDAVGEVKVDQIWKGTTQVFDWSVYNFQWYDGPAAGPLTPKAGETNYNLKNLAAGTYSVIATHKTITECSSVPVEVIVQDQPLGLVYELVKVSDQTKCAPFDGAITANFFGADITGATIVWTNALSNEVVANNVTSITGLKGDILYQITVSRGTCSSSQFLALTAPTYPKGIASTVRDVMSCLNPQDGKVTARAIYTDINGIDVVDTDTTATKYKFTWYNFVNGARGSQIPNQPTLGPSAIGLVEGFYEVVITNLQTNCTSKDPILPTEVKKGYTLPTVDFGTPKPQTSCDPLVGNAALQAIAFENGFPAVDQTKYNYFWYAGQNTITKLRDNNNVIVNNSLLEDVQGGVKGGGQAYTVEIVDKVTGCSATNFTTAPEDINYPDVTLAPTNNDVCPNTSNILFTGAANSSVTFDGAAVTDFTNYTFKWYSGAVVGGAVLSNAQQLINLGGGTYTLQVEETVLKCKSTPKTVQILDVTSNPVLVPGVEGSTNCTNPPLPNGRAFVASINGVAVPPSGVLAPFTFQWYTGSTPTAPNIIAGSTVGFINQLAGSNDPTLANYTVSVLNDKGCSSVLTIHIPDNRTIPTLALAPLNNVNCAAGNGVLFTGSINALITNQVGALTDYTFTWSEPAMGTVVGTNNLQNIPAGTYSLVVKHTVTGCESPISVATVSDEITLPTVLADVIGSTNCAPAKPGNGSALVTSIDALPANSPGYSIEWFAGATATGAVIATTPATPSNIQGAVNALFTVKVKKLANNCENTATVQVPDLSALPIPVLSQTENTKCAAPFDGSAIVTSISYKGNPYLTLANIKYDWYTGTGTGTPVNPAVNNATLSQVADGFYSATVTMVNEGCTSNFVAVEVLDGKVIPVATVVPVGSKNCPGGTPDGSANVTAITPADTYEHRWYAGNVVTPGTEINSGVNDTDIAGLQGGPAATYIVEVKSTTTRCTGTETVIIPDIKQLPIISGITPANNINCDEKPDGTPVVPVGSVTMNTLTFQGNTISSPYTGFTFTWTGTGAPAPGANIPALTNKPSGVYTLQVTNITTNCTSDLVSQTILDAPIYPTISNVVTDQTSCDINNPNGQVKPTIGGTTVDVIEWFAGTGNTPPVLPMDPDGTLRNRASGSYTIQVYNSTTGCAADETVFVPNNIVYPDLTYSSITPVGRCDTPDGAVTPNISGTSNPQNFTWYYVFTPEGSTAPFDPAVVKAGTATNGSTPGNQTPLTNISPGYITAMVRDNNTTCESNPNTAQIENNTTQAVITFQSSADAGFCDLSTPTGALNVNVTSVNPIVSYEWYRGTPTNTNPIDFILNANPPTFATPAIQFTEDLTGVVTGVYTLVVKDNRGCGNYYIDNVPFLGAPTVTITHIDNTTCDVAALNGSIRVQVAGVSPSYQVSIHNGTGPNLPALTDVTTFDVTRPNLGQGTYYIQVRDLTPANSGCPLGFGETIDQKAFSPLLALDQVNPNTACDGAAVGEGSITLIATQDAADETTPDFAVSLISPVITTTPPIALTEGVGEVITGFHSDNYVITVIDNTTKCENSIAVTIPDQPIIPQSISVAVIDDKLCAPATSGQLQITGISPGLVGDYLYDWYDEDMNIIVTASPALTFNNPNINPTAGLGNGSNTFFVRGVKNAGTGQGCPTPIVMRTIKDIHVAPQPDLSSTPNTSCAPGIGEGSVTLNASTAFPSDPAIQNSTYSYVFNLVTNFNAQAAPVVIPTLEGAAYPVQVKNDVNGCITNSSVTVIDAQFSFEITDNTLAHQLICDPNGNIVVTEITLDRSLMSQPPVIYNTTLTNDFDFEWTTSGSATPLQDSGNNPIVSESLLTGNLAGQYPTMGAGTYFVTATRKPTAPGAGCQTPPYRVDILDKHINPVVALAPESNTSCDLDPANAEGKIAITVTDATVGFGPYQYAYTWTTGTVVMPFPNVNDGNGVTNGDNDNPLKLVDGPYALDVRNIQTGCIVSASTTVTKNEIPVIVAQAISIPQTFCSNNGSAEVTLVQIIQNNVKSAAPLIDFTYTWERDNAVILTTTDVLLDNVNYPAIGAGTYFVSARRTANPSSDGGPGFNCVSPPFRVDIEDRINYPSVNITPSSNTACTDDENFFEGSATINITETGPGSGATYEYTWTSNDPTNTSLVLTQAPKPTGPGTNDVQTGLRDDTYLIEVRNLTTDCPVNTQTTVVKTAVPVIITEATTTPKLICDPDGSALVTKIQVGTNPFVDFLPADMMNFDFTWSEADLPNVLPLPAQGTSVLDNTTYPAITDNSLTYFVSAKLRDDAVNPDASPAIGKGCSSAPVMVTILDQSQNPTVTFDITQNTSCNNLNPDGRIIATAADPDGLPHPFIFTWTYDGVLPVNTLPFTNGTDQNGYTSAPEGTYTLLLENDDTGCTITQVQEVILNRNVSLPNILSVVPTDPTDCNGSGIATVTGVYIGNISNNFPGSDPRFVYTWYTQYTDETTNTPIPAQTNEVLPGLNPGIYFVTVMDTDLGRNCESGPNQVEIEDPIANYPVVVIEQTLPQISCRTDEGTAMLEASADNGNTAAPYLFSWYTGLDAEDGNELLDQANVQRTGFQVDQILQGTYSVRVLNTVTNCSSEQYYIIQDDRNLFFPELTFSTGPRTRCDLPNGILEIRETGYNNLNTTNPGQIDYYSFPPNFTAHFTPGPMSTVDPDFLNPMTPSAGFDPVNFRTWEATGLDAFEVFTVKIIDENTGCPTIKEVEIPDNRNNPVVEIVMENPLVNCYSAKPNGQLLAIADQRPSSEYTFAWYAGQITVDPNVPSVFPANDKLIGVGAAESPDLWFTVYVVNNTTHCPAQASLQLTDVRVPGEAPDARTVQDDDRCDLDNGWVTADVDGVTFNHNFFWFDGNITAVKNESDLPAADHAEPDYRDLAANFYTVYAQNRETGCISLPVATEVKDITVIPELFFEVTASFCEDVPDNISNQSGNGTVSLTLDPADLISESVTWTREVDLSNAGTGNYVAGLWPGFYTVDVVTNKGCAQTGRVEIPTDILSYNLVTQNQDNKNDKFIIDCISRFPNNEVMIFNRSGIMVYKAHHYDNDGTVFEGIGKNGVYMAGTLLPVGTYFYIIDKGDGSKPKTGYLELVR